MLRAAHNTQKRQHNAQHFVLSPIDVHRIARKNNKEAKSANIDGNGFEENTPHFCVSHSLPSQSRLQAWVQSLGESARVCRGWLGLVSRRRLGCGRGS